MLLLVAGQRIGRAWSKRAAVHVLADGARARGSAGTTIGAAGPSAGPGYRRAQVIAAATTAQVAGIHALTTWRLRLGLICRNAPCLLVLLLFLCHDASPSSPGHRCVQPSTQKSNFRSSPAAVSAANALGRVVEVADL